MYDEAQREKDNKFTREFIAEELPLFVLGKSDFTLGSYSVPSEIRFRRKSVRLGLKQ